MFCCYCDVALKNYYWQNFGLCCRPVKNFDEVTFHFIECIHTHLQTSKLQVSIITWIDETITFFYTFIHLKVNLDRMRILCLLYLFMVYLHSLKLQGNSATQPQSVDSSLSTPVRSGSSGYQTAPSNQVSYLTLKNLHFKLSCSCLACN